jgi:hypothetical protein
MSLHPQPLRRAASIRRPVAVAACGIDVPPLLAEASFLILQVETRTPSCSTSTGIDVQMGQTRRAARRTTLKTRHEHDTTRWT